MSCPCFPLPLKTRSCLFLSQPLPSTRSLGNSGESFNILDVKPENMEELTEVITSATFHPINCNHFIYSSSKGTIKMADMRENSLCDRHSKRMLLFLLSEGNDVKMYPILIPPPSPPSHHQCLRRRSTRRTRASSRKSSRPSLTSSLATTASTFSPATT